MDGPVDRSIPRSTSRLPRAPALLLCLAPCLMAASAPAGGVLIIDVGNVRVAKGHVHVDICPETRFLNDNCPYSAQAPATKGVARSVPAGRYAVQAFLDENDNGKVDRALFGIPKEGVGFSNDAKITLGPPKFAEAAFDYDGGLKTIHFSLRYFLGDKGPNGH